MLQCMGREPDMPSYLRSPLQQSLNPNAPRRGALELPGASDDGRPPPTRMRPRRRGRSGSDCNGGRLANVVRLERPSAGCESKSCVWPLVLLMAWLQFELVSGDFLKRRGMHCALHSGDEKPQQNIPQMRSRSHSKISPRLGRVASRLHCSLVAVVMALDA